MLPVNRLTQFVSQNHLFDADDIILAAVSGGMDSVLMAHLLKAAGYQFVIAHCNFRLRGAEADADQDFCRRLAGELNVQFHTTKFDTKAYAADHRISIQMAARELRYNWFSELRERHGYRCIALAHHQNDTIETILLNLTRGTGIAGLHGILPLNGDLVRPMLFLQRNEIEELVRQVNIAYREDSSNASTKYARNKIRHEVIPVLKQLNPNLEETFERSVQHFRELEQLLMLQLSDRQKLFSINDNGDVLIPLSVVMELRPQRLLLFNLLKPYGFNETQTDDIISCLDKHAGRMFDSPTYMLVLDRDQLIIRKKSSVGVRQVVSIERGQEDVEFNNYRLTLLHDDTPLVIKNNPLATSIDADKIVYPLNIRSWQQGDWFCPLGMEKRQKVSDYFTQQKIPLHAKADIPLLVNGNGDIIWIAGYRLDNRYKVTDKTEKVVIFELYKLL